jgi:hypothetical protein
MEWIGKKKAAIKMLEVVVLCSSQRKRWFSTERVFEQPV